MIWIAAESNETSRLMTRLIGVAGYPAMAVGFGDELLKRLSFVQPNLLVLVCSMHEQSQVLANIRVSNAGCNFPILIVDLGREDASTSLLAASADGYVHNGPQAAVKLLSEIERLVGKP